jgi:hypothetical protein
MFDRKNVTLVIQGNVTQWTPAFIEEYKKSFDNIIVSTWDDETIKADGFRLIKSQKPDNPGPGNINMQIKSSHEGIVASDTEYTLKIRSDILIKEPEKWLEFMYRYLSQNRIFVMGLSHMYPFSARDQFFFGSQKDMITLFNIPYLQSPYTPSPNVNGMYPEYWLTLLYYSQFSQKVKMFLQNPEAYLYGNAPYKQQVFEEWRRIATHYMYPVSRNLDYYWPKHFGEGKYNYDETAITYGNFWHEDIS